MSLSYGICLPDTPLKPKPFLKYLQNKANNSPCFLVAKFLCYNLSQLETEAVRYFLRQVRVWATAKYFDIRHFSVVQGVVQSKQAAAASGCRVRAMEESKTTTGNWSTVEELLLASLSVFPTYPPLCPTHPACSFLWRWRARFCWRRHRNYVFRPWHSHVSERSLESSEAEV